ncbi:formate C-acetyltransferase [Klebsiella pneumoniae]|uniref:Formate C-acetyltransferase n=1 Tax=Klebsiella pneumoniae TaxID=573 RepID=A0A378AXN7_KLEPN|nr:formate C-acetyltransferase [Klebsiella pneumoniae]
MALYGIRYLVRERELQFADLQPALERGEALEATLRLREELAEQRRALLQMQEMAARYGWISLTRRALPGRRCSGSTSPTWRR